MKTYIIRGSFANQYELQNYEPLVDKYNIRIISSKNPLTSINMPTIKLWSPVDLPKFPYKMSLLNRLFTDAHYLLGLESVIQQAGIVHVAETYYGYTHQAVEMKKRGQVGKLVSTAWETIPYNNEGIRGRKQRKQDAHKHIDLFIAPTERAQNALIREGVAKDKIVLIPMGVDLNRFKPSRKHNEKVLNILFVGRLVEEKGIYTLLRAVKQLRNNFNLTLVGKGNIQLKLPDNVHVKTASYEEMPNIYHTADIFVFPSQTTKHWEEQYGMALVEAMASGLPIIASDSGAVPEVLGQSGIIFEEGNSTHLAKSLNKLINDEKLRNKLGALARKRAEARYDRNKTAHQIERVYNSLI